MIVYALTLLACMHANPQHCERHELQVQSCNAGGIGQLATWAFAHPNWFVKRWHCGEGQPT
jgi:hypothetical protein